MNKLSWAQRLQRIREIKLRGAMAALHQVVARRNDAQGRADRIADASDSLGRDGAALGDLAPLGEARMLWHRRAAQFGEQVQAAASAATHAQHRRDQADNLVRREKQAAAAARERKAESEVEEFFAWRR